MPGFHQMLDLCNCLKQCLAYGGHFVRPVNSNVWPIGTSIDFGWGINLRLCSQFASEEHRRLYAIITLFLESGLEIDLNSQNDMLLIKSGESTRKRARRANTERSTNVKADTLKHAGYLKSVHDRKRGGEVQNSNKRGAGAVDWATNVCEIRAMYANRGFVPVVTTQSSQAHLLWARCSSFQHIRH